MGIKAKVDVDPCWSLSHTLEELAVDVCSYDVRDPVFQDDRMRAVHLGEYFGIVVSWMLKWWPKTFGEDFEWTSPSLELRVDPTTMKEIKMAELNHHLIQSWFGVLRGPDHHLIDHLIFKFRTDFSQPS